MPGRPLTRERKRLDEERAEQLQKLGLAPGSVPLPTTKRTVPVTFSEELGEEAVILGACGLSLAEVAAHWSISRETLGRWRDEHKAFADALERAQTAGLAWWEERVRVAIATGDNRFPAGAWISVMKARFPDYMEKVEVSHRLDVTQRLVLVDLRSDPPPAAPTVVLEHCA